MTPYEDQEKIPIGMLVRRVGGFDPYADELKIRYRSDPIGIHWSEGVAGLIPYHDRLKVRSPSI